MNLQQLDYIIAVDTHRHFVKAAEKCFVTQATLSMMIKKLEDELEVKIFDRSRLPVTVTKEGEEIINRARQIISAAEGLKKYTRELKGDISGDLHLGIIPTLAPYLLPLFLKNFVNKFPQLRTFIKELVTEDIVAKLQSGELDIGILATPLNVPGITEHKLFYEELFAYVSKNENLKKKKYLLPREIYPDHLWLLEEGHCLRNQIFNLCELKKSDPGSDGLHYEAGSIETLINMVDKNDGITIVPQLATMLLKSGQKKNIREFANPKPVREISLVTVKDFPRKMLLKHLASTIIEAVPQPMHNHFKKKVTQID